jgi:hypothetical protein
MRRNIDTTDHGPCFQAILDEFTQILYSFVGGISLGEKGKGRAATSLIAIVGYGINEYLNLHG